MEEHAFIEAQVVGNNSAGYNRPLNRNNQPPILQKENYKEKNAIVKRCFFLCIGLLIGSVVSGIIAFLVVKYSGILFSHNESSCLWSKWSEWIGCNSLLSSVTERRIQIYTGHANNCQQNERTETRICQDRILDIRFDPTTLYSTRFLSYDYTILGNRYTDRTPYNPKARSQFKNYRGAIVNKCVDHSTSVYFEIYFRYVISSKLDMFNLVLELGIGERDKIDYSLYVADESVNGWSFYLVNSELSHAVLLKAVREPSVTHEIVKLFSSNTVGTIANGTLGILIDRERNHFSLFYNDTVLFTFRDVLSNVSLCPVFGVYNPTKVQVDLQIVSVGNMTLMS